jgi:multidrug efflux system outer membrane protein
VEQAIRAKEHELCLLLGRNPGPVARGRALEKLGIRMTVPAGLPSRLLERRPDILAVEQQLVAANADIGVARAAYFPKLQLTASGGISSIEFDQLVDAGSRTWSMATALAGPIFDAGKTRLGVKAREAKQAQILASYEKALQTGFREVADALNAVEKSRRIVDRQEALVHALSKVAELARTRYKEGAATYLEVLDAERQRFEGEIKLADARRMQLKAVVQTYKALGGGWKAE